MNRSPHTEHSSVLFGAKVVQVNEFSEGHEAHGVGGAIFGETTLVPGWLELELNIAMVRLGEELVLPIDLLLKKPLHFGSICPYVAAGPALSVVFEEERTVHVGGIAVLGAYVFFHRKVGLDLEVEYSVFPADGLIHELTLAFGPVFRL